MQYFMLGKHSFQIIMRIFGRTASAARFSILRKRPAPFREGAEYASASYSAAPGAHAQAELSFHRSHSAAKCDVGWQSETYNIHFSTSCSLDKVKRHSTTTVLCLSTKMLRRLLYDRHRHISRDRRGGSQQAVMGVHRLKTDLLRRHTMNGDHLRGV